MLVVVGAAEEVPEVAPAEVADDPGVVAELPVAGVLADDPADELVGPAAAEEEEETDELDEATVAELEGVLEVEFRQEDEPGLIVKGAD